MGWFSDWRQSRAREREEQRQRMEELNAEVRQAYLAGQAERRRDPPEWVMWVPNDAVRCIWPDDQSMLEEPDREAKVKEAFGKIGVAVRERRQAGHNQTKIWNDLLMAGVPEESAAEIMRMDKALRPVLG